METVLMVAVVLITLAVIAQAGVLIGMYIMSRRLGDQVEALMNESQKLIAPVEAITSNLKTVTEDLTETGKIAREQVLHVQEMLLETQASVREQVTEIREVVRDTVDEARSIVMRPIRQYSAIASGISAGVRTFFARGKTASTPTEAEITIEEERQFPAAS